MPKKDQHNRGQQANDTHPATALTVNEARDAILALITATAKTESVSAIDALGRTIATDIVTTTAIPPFQNSAMDGYAIRHQDAVPDQQFKIIGKSLAGHPFAGSLSAGEAVRVTTGAAVPAGADAIVIQELARIEGDTFTTAATIEANQYIRNPGDDILPGQLLFKPTTRLTAADIGLLAAQGINQVEVFANARVGVFSTGDELHDSAETLPHGHIFDSNRATIQSILKMAGINAVDMGICRDDPEAIKQTMKLADDMDFVLSSGGVSVGEADYVREVLQANGELFFWKVAMKPGKPLVSGKLSRGAYYFGLPGNPVSSMVTCLQFVIPAIRAFSGVTYQPPLTLQATCLDPLKKEVGRFEFQRGIASTGANGELTVSTTGLQDSHVLSSMSQANCFICLDQNSAGAAADETVPIILFNSVDGM